MTKYFCIHCQLDTCILAVRTFTYLEYLLVSSLIPACVHDWMEESLPHAEARFEFEHVLVHRQCGYEESLAVTEPEHHCKCSHALSILCLETQWDHPRLLSSSKGSFPSLCWDQEFICNSRRFWVPLLPTPSTGPTSTSEVAHRFQ